MTANSTVSTKAFTKRLLNSIKLPTALIKNTMAAAIKTGTSASTESPSG